MDIEYAQGKFSADEVIKHLSLTGQLSAIAAEMIKAREVIKKADDMEITVSGDELQKFVDNFRTLHCLYSAEETMNFLSNSGLTVEDLETFCETTLLTAALKDRLADEKSIEAYFINNRAEFDLARISVAIVADENLANEIILQVTEDEEDFHALARAHSMDEATRYAGGHLGLISRSRFSPEMSAKVFNASSGDLLEPFPIQEGFQLILVEELIKPELNEDIKTLIKEKIFNQWSSRFLEKGVKVLL